MKLVGLIVAVLGYVLISKEKVERCCFVISRSAVQFRPLAPYKTIRYEIRLMAHFDYVGTM